MLRYFRDCGVDAVLHNGDISDWGVISGWRLAAEAWERVFPGDRAPDGRKVVKLFTTGNHDFEGVKYGHQGAEMQANGISRAELLVDNDLPAQWEKFFGRRFVPVDRWNVNGYEFITTHWNHRTDIVPWMKAHGGELAGDKPFFFFQHVQPDGTIVAGSSGDGGVAVEAFSNRKSSILSGKCRASTRGAPPQRHEASALAENASAASKDTISLSRIVGILYHRAAACVYFQIRLSALPFPQSAAVRTGLP